jgi:Flp pilus assembly protein TadD
MLPMSTRHYLALTALAAALSLLPACTTTHGKAGSGEQAGSEDSSGEPDLLQKLRDRMSHGGAHAAKPKAKAESTATAAADTSRASSASALAAAGGKVTLDPVRQQQMAAVSADYAKALRLMRKGKDDQAMDLLQSVVNRAPTFSGPMVNQGLILLKQRQFDRAERVFKRATTINPRSAYAFNMMGLTQREQGHFADAKASYETALALDPDYARAHFNLGVLADLYMQDLPLALQHYQAYQSLQCKPDKVVGNWITDLQKRSGTYIAPQAGAAPAIVTPTPTLDCNAPDKPADTADSGIDDEPAATAASGAPAAAATSGSPAASATSGSPAASDASGVALASARSGSPVASATSGVPAAAPAAIAASGSPAPMAASAAHAASGAPLSPANSTAAATAISGKPAPSPVTTAKADTAPAPSAASAPVAAKVSQPAPAIPAPPAPPAGSGTDMPAASAGSGPRSLPVPTTKPAHGAGGPS